MSDNQPVAESASPDLRFQRCVRRRASHASHSGDHVHGHGTEMTAGALCELCAFTSIMRFTGWHVPRLCIKQLALHPGFEPCLVACSRDITLLVHRGIMILSNTQLAPLYIKIHTRPMLHIQCFDLMRQGITPAMLDDKSLSGSKTQAHYYVHCSATTRP